MLKNSEYIDKNIIIEDKNETNKLGKKAQVGYDLTLKNIYDIEGSGFISKYKTYIANYNLRKIEHLKYNDIEFDGWFLPKGAYIAETNEGCHLGNNDTAYIIQRSSLNRNNVSTCSSLWDPGFTTQENDKVNTMTIRIIVDNPDGVYIEKNARFAQMIVATNEPTNDYNGQFQNGSKISKI